MKTQWIPITLVCLSQLACVAGELNSTVLKTAKAYSDGGGYELTPWKDTGTPEAIIFKGAIILKKATNGTYCSGFTFAVAMKSMTNTLPIGSNTVSRIRQFQQQWYGATQASKEKQCVMAAEALGVGKAILVNEAKAGDFVQFWRKTTNQESGHSAVFLRWTTNAAGQRAGLEYRSSQGTNDGIGNHIEHFSGLGGKVDTNRMYFCRLFSN